MSAYENICDPGKYFDVCLSCVLPDQLCEFAQSWAEQLLESGKLQHRPDSEYGENIYSSWSR